MHIKRKLAFGKSDAVKDEEILARPPLDSIENCIVFLELRGADGFLVIELLKPAARRLRSRCGHREPFVRGCGVFYFSEG